jgi:O-antigen ligase
MSPLLPASRRLPRARSIVRSKRSDIIYDRPPLAVQIFLYGVCVVWTGLLIPIEQIFFGGTESQSDNVDLTGSVWLSSLFNTVIVISGIYIFIITLFTRKIKYLKYHGLLLICVIVLASAFWSLAPDITLKRGLTFVGSMLLIIYFVEILGPDRVFRCLTQQMLLIGVFSAITRVVWRSYSIMPGTHALAGIYGNKNSFGAVMAVSILGALFLYTRDKILYRRYFMVAIFFLICDILSTSGTTITIGLIFFYIFSLHTLARRGGISRILAILGCIPLLGVAVMADVAPDALFGLLGKDATLTGRTELWPYVIDLIDERPWIGWGYRSFWQQNNPLAVDLWNKLGWIIPESHNGLLDVLLDVGYVGCAVFAYVFLATGITAVQNLKAGNSAIGVTAIMAFVGYLVYGISEQILLIAGLPSIMFYLIAISGIYEYRRYWASSRASR